MKITQFKSQAGQTIVEILIVTVVVASVLTALAASLSMSSKNTTENKKLSMSTSYSQEALEAFHRERYALGWEEFESALTDGVYCLDTIPANSNDFMNLVSGECAVSETISGTDFIREIELTTSVDEVKVVVVVKWNDSGNVKQTTVEQTFKDIN